ncbi:hypothetical protein RND81_04G233900 [Saponaria officinalis]|uniref:Neprosin PEP catalytic domain-containing protein n=1 Tax=Saponaria officinalis TaxID=3572 RepID=A0AAW1LPB3_SAPOF
MEVKGVTILLVILCSLFSNAVCRVIDHNATNYKTDKNNVEIQVQKQFSSKLEENGHPSPKEHCRAVVRTRTNDVRKFFGTRAWVSLYRPKVLENQWSSSRFKLLNGVESIEAGWMVNPEVFKDNEAHLYTKFSAGGKECINTLCPGFVVHNTSVPLGYVPDVYSQVGVHQWAWDITIKKHQDDGNWWFSVMADKEEEVLVGYWPKSLFTSLAEVASQVEWGGEIHNPGASSTQPEMGSGRVATYSTSQSAFFQRVSIINEDFQYVQPDNTEKDSDCDAYYRSLDRDSHDPYWGRLIFFGGPNEK